MSSPPKAPANAEGAVVASIEHYLLGLGHSLHRAQEKLGRLATTVQEGEAPVVFQVPRLDFEFKVSIDLDDDDDAPQLRLRPAQGSGAVTDGDVASLIRGSLVAVPMHGRRERPRLTVEVRRLGEGRDRRITAVLTDLDDRALVKVPVSFDLATEAGTPAPEGIALDRVQARTSEAGRANVVLQVSDDAPADAACVVRVEALGVVSRLRVQPDERPA